MTTRLYRPGDLTDEIVRRLCMMFEAIACKAKLQDKEGLRGKSHWVDRYGVDVQFDRAKRGLIRVRFVTDDDCEIELNLAIQDLARDRSLWEAIKQDTIQAIRKHRRQRPPLEIRAPATKPTPLAVAVAAGMASNAVH